jgi:hypothetical protein
MTKPHALSPSPFSTALTRCRCKGPKFSCQVLPKAAKFAKFRKSRSVTSSEPDICPSNPIWELRGGVPYQGPPAQSDPFTHTSDSGSARSALSPLSLFFLHGSEADLSRPLYLGGQPRHGAGTQVVQPYHHPQFTPQAAVPTWMPLSSYRRVNFCKVYGLSHADVAHV